MRKYVLMLAACLLLNQTQAQTQDSVSTTTLSEVVISGTRFEVPLEKSGKIIFKVSEKDLNRAAGRSLADILHQTPGVQMDGNYSSPGANISYYIRGGRNRHSLITLDGIPMIDPAGIEPNFDMRFLSTAQLESVEVLQGSLSTLYGSSAAGGIVNLYSKKSNSDGIHGSASTTAGSWNSFSQNVSLNGQSKKFSFTLSGNNFTSDGFSAAKDTDPLVRFDKDGFKRQNAMATVGYALSSKLSVKTFFAYDNFENDYDGGAFFDSNDSQHYSQNRFGVQGKYEYTKGTLSLVAQNSLIDRKEKGTYPTRYTGSNVFAEIVHKHELTNFATLLSGTSFQKLSYGETDVNEQDTTNFTIVDPYTSLLLELPRQINIHAGVRLNTHSTYGSRLIYNINPSWLIPISSNAKINVFASVATAYITPTLFQLNTMWGGNSNLKPEDNFTVEYGATLNVTDQFKFTAVNYYRTESNAIGYSPDFSYINVTGKRYVNGVTLSMNWKPVKNLMLETDYNYVTTNRPQTFYRIPEHKVGAAIQYESEAGTWVSLRYQHTGERKDTFYPNEVLLSSFNLFDLTAGHRFLKNKFQINGTIANLLDEDFVGVYGYTTRGRNFLVSLMYSF
jgi:vitamin B12 transporter